MECGSSPGKRMHAAGHAFYRSENGVWLTDAVPPAHIRFPGDDPHSISRNLKT